MLRVRVALSGFTGGPGLSTFYFTSGTYDVATATRVRARVHALFSNGLRTVMWNGASWTVDSVVDQIDPATGDTVNSFAIGTGLTGVGTAGVDACPIAAAALVAWNTSTFTGGKRLRGRTFVSPLAEAAINPAGAMVATITAGMLTHLGNYINTPAEGDASVIWHRPVNGAGGFAGQITAAVMRDKVAVLTSRRD